MRLINRFPSPNRYVFATLGLPNSDTLRDTLHNAVKKTSLYLTDGEVERLRRLARLEHTSQAEIVRRAIARYTPTGPPDRNFAMFDSGEGDGRSVADIPEEELLEGFGS